MREIVKSSTDQSVVVRIIDATTGVPEEGVDYDTAGLALWYRREGAAKVAITPAALASLDAAHSDGGIEHIDDGYYRLDLPDAAVASGADGVMVGGAVTDMIVVGCYVPLVDARATASALATVDTVVDAIKLKTDNLPAAPAASGDIPTAAAVADAVWDETLADHLTAGSTGEGLNAAGSAGDPWATALPGAYGAGTAGKIVGDNLNATVSSRSSHGAADVKTAIEAAGSHLTLIKAVTDNLPDGGALTSLATAAALTTVDAVVDAIRAKTDNLPAAPAATGDIPTAGTIADAVWNETLADHLNTGSTGAGLNAAGSAGDPWATALPGAYGAGTAGKIIGDNLNAPVATVDAVVDAIKAKTDNLPAAPAASGDIPTAGAVADAVWDETLADHLTAGSTGAGLNAAGSAGDPWATALPGAYGAGTAGKIIGDNLNAPVATVDSVVDAIKAKTDNLPASPAATGDIPTAAAVADAVWDETLGDHLNPGSTGAGLNAAGSVGDPWATALPGAYGAGTAGKIVGDNLNATVSSRSSHGAADVKTAIEAAGSHLTLIKAVTDNLPDGGALTSLATAAALTTVDAVVDAIRAKTDNLPAAPAATGDIPTAAAVADAVWDETLGDHLNTGSTGAGLNAAGSVGDPWATALPGAYGAGTAGKIVGDNLNATVSSRSSHGAADVKTAIEAAGSHLTLIKAVTDNLPDGGALTSLATAAGLTTVDTVVNAIKLKTDNLPASPAATGDIPTAAAVADAVWDEAIAGHVTAGTFGEKSQKAVPSETIGDYKADVSALALEATAQSILTDTGTEIPATLATIAGYIDTEVAAIKAKTDNLPDSGALLALANLDAAVSSRSSHDAADVKAAIEAAGGHLALIKAVTDALTAAAAAKLAASAGTIVTGQAAAGTLSTTQMTTNLTEDTNDHYNGRVVIWTSGALSTQASAITDYDGAGKMLTFTAVTEAPTAGDGFVIV